MKLQGSLAERDLPDLLQALHERRWSGILTLTHMGVGRSLTIQDGRLVFAASSSPDDRLGELLLRRGRISLKQFLDAGKAVSPGKRLGTILVEQGVLPPKELVKAVVDQTQEIIYGAFQWIEGQYRLEEGAASKESITLRISTPNIILEGIRRIESWSRIFRGVGGILAQYERSLDHAELLSSATLSPEQMAIVTALDSRASVESICSLSSLQDFEVCRTLWAFRVIGLVRRMDAPQVSRPPLEDEGLAFVVPQE